MAGASGEAQRLPPSSSLPERASVGQAHVALHARCAAKLVLQCWILTMSQTLLNPRIGVPHWEPKYPFDLVVAYEDLASRKRALQLYDHLAGQLLDEYDFQCAWWKFEHLQDRHLHARETIEQPAQAMPPLLAHMAQHKAAIPRWGINE